LDPLDYKSWAQGLKKAGYATNPKYTTILIKYIEVYRLNEYSAFALGKMKEMPGLPDGVLVQGGASGGAVSTRPVKSEMEAVMTSSNGKSPVGEATAEQTLIGQQSSKYPTGEFLINDTRVIYANAGSSIRSIAEQYHFNDAWILDFNDLASDVDLLERGQLVFLQRKRKRGDQAFHEVVPGESLYDISQSRGIRLESLMALNHLEKNMEPAPGTKLYLQDKAPARPELAMPGMQVTANKSASIQADAAGQDIREIRHMVQPKETLYSLARKYEVGVDQIKAWNKLESADLKPGQELLIIKRL
jgi:LysM repeat protein